MSYKRPKLAMFMGSSGGYWAFADAMKEFGAAAIAKGGRSSRGGAIYLVEHRYRPESSYMPLKFQALGVDMKKSKTREGMRLGRGFYLCPGFYGNSRPPSSERNPSVAIKRSDDGILRFHDFGVPVNAEDMFDFQVEKALEAGYTNDMLLVVLSGHGGSGNIIKKIGESKRGSHIIIQEPKEAKVGQLPRNAIADANLYRHSYDGLDYEILRTGLIGGRVMEFFGSDRLLL